jgi:hypothetical protein
MDNTMAELAERADKPRWVQILSTPASKVGLAVFQNAISVMRGLSVVDDNEAEIREQRLIISFQPSFVSQEPRTSTVSVPANSTHQRP